MLVSHTGFEPVIFWVKARYPKPLDEWDLASRMGFEPMISTLRGWHPKPLDERDRVFYLGDHLRIVKRFCNHPISFRFLIG